MQDVTLFFRESCVKSPHTVLEAQLSEIQGALKDVTPAWLVLSRHQHQVGVDKHGNLDGGSDREKVKEGERWKWIEKKRSK